MSRSIKRTKAELQNEIKELEERLTKLETDLRTPLDPDSTERATQMENREVLEKLEILSAQRLEALRKELSGADN